MSTGLDNDPAQQACLTVGIPTACLSDQQWPQPLQSTKDVIEPHLLQYWLDFNPDLQDVVEEFRSREPREAVWDDVRLRSAPWDTADWDNASVRSDDPDEPDDDPQPTMPPSEPEEDPHPDDPPFGAPLRTWFLPGAVNLLEPPLHRLPPDAQVSDPAVPPVPPLHLQGPDAEYILQITTDGVNLPRSRDAPLTFRSTRPSELMDTVIRAWIDAQLLLTRKSIKAAMPMFLVPKPDNTVRPIVDYSTWTNFIDTPRFSLLSAAKALNEIPWNSYMIKIDLKSGFHQLRINPVHENFHGIFYRGLKWGLTRLPMGHALAPGVFQRFAKAVVHHVTHVTRVQGVVYLDDWLLYSNSRGQLLHATDIIRNLGITINDKKSILLPTQEMTYLGFIINTERHTIKLTLAAWTQLRDLLRYAKNGSEKDRQRIQGYASWILYNLGYPLFLGHDILRGDPSWLIAAMESFDFLRLRPMLRPPLEVHLFTDATPHSIAAIIPSMDLAFAQAYRDPEEINHAEFTALMVGLQWAAEEFTDCTFVVYTDNASALSAARTGRGRILRRQDMRRLFLSTLEKLKDNAFRVEPILSADNPADQPSRQVLASLHAIHTNERQVQPIVNEWYAFQQP